ETGQSLWQVLPLNPTDGGSDHSPYSSISAFAGNAFFISPVLSSITMRKRKNSYLTLTCQIRNQKWDRNCRSAGECRALKAFWLNPCPMGGFCCRSRMRLSANRFSPVSLR
ncbi:4-alpha-glucanotransferase, partial [Acetomicrobium sp. S15 = DSM 107314]|uniref:4-alpha-glucanotransferase n=1 Tax=Acetomicrobium sp. S15 = DSM 107314 TaxID=2529858 RepID=UPI0018E0E757